MKASVSSEKIPNLISDKAARNIVLLADWRNTFVSYFMGTAKNCLGTPLTFAVCRLPKRDALISLITKIINQGLASWYQILPTYINRNGGDLVRRIDILSVKIKGEILCFQMLLQEKADALREEAEEMTTAPEEPNSTDTELHVWPVRSFNRAVFSWVS